MSQYDLRLDVPARAVINAQLLVLLQEGGTLLDAKRRLFSTQPYDIQFSADDRERYRLDDHSLTIPLLYCCVVVPREYLDLPTDHQIYQDLDAANVGGLFTATEPIGLTSYQLIRSLRHSIAHALFSISDDSPTLYQFWTERPPLFRAAIRHHELLQFVSQVGPHLANAVLAEKRGLPYERRPN